MGGLTDQIKDKVNDKSIAHMEAIINSMTKKERANPDIIKGSRKRRIAAGAGVDVHEVNVLLRQFDMMQKNLKSTEMKKILPHSKKKQDRCLRCTGVLSRFCVRM